MPQVLDYLQDNNILFEEVLIDHKCSTLFSCPSPKSVCSEAGNSEAIDKSLAQGLFNNLFTSKRLIPSSDQPGHCG